MHTRQPINKNVWNAKEEKNDDGFNWGWRRFGEINKRGYLISLV